MAARANHSRPMITPLPQPALNFQTPEVWVFDLDNTLYPASCNLFKQIDLRMGAFIANLLKVNYEEARRVQKDFYRIHGTTLRGLMLEYQVDPEEFLHFVHDIDLSPLPCPSPLGPVLERLPGRKLVFTNASGPYAARVLERLEIAHHFEAVFDIAHGGYIPKPDRSSYAKLIERHAINPAKAAMFEDIARNLAPAAEMGMTTVWVPSGNEPIDHFGAGDGHIDHVVDDLAVWLQELA